MLRRGEIWRMGREYNGYTRHDCETEAAHMGPHGISQKAGDDTAIPLCGIAHHREGRESAHKLGRRFSEYHQLDIQEFQRELRAEYAGETK